jgi:hypothetical protein
MSAKMKEENRALIAQWAAKLTSILLVRIPHEMAQHNSAGERNVIGLRIRKARLSQKPPVSQEDLAARLAVRGIHLDRSALSRMQSRTRFIRDYEIVAILDALRVSIASLFGER